jgi:predicted acylesterase/phospholipase RssA
MPTRGIEGTSYARSAPMKLQCDLVMRGGIASGLVYPRAIAKLAETHDFRSIGGTSVGAIAAAGTAAAAWGTKVGQDHFQTRLKHLPEELSEIRDGKTVLERLFQPQPGTRRLFRVLMAGLRHENKFLKVARIIALLCLNYLPIAVLGAAIDENECNEAHELGLQFAVGFRAR